jgi:O-antigen ligase
MVAERPLTGVGPRGFRYVYAAYADPGDPFINDTQDEGAKHAHNHVLEVLTETGLVGVVALLAFYAMLIRGWRQAPPARRAVALPFALALLAVLFPLNSNNALYSSYWSQFIWWLVALFCAALAGTANPRRPQP